VSVNTRRKDELLEHKRVEQSLGQSEAKYRILFESSQDAIMTLAPPSWRFTSGNPATVEMFATKDEAEFISLGPCEVSPEIQPDGRRSAEKAREMIETAIREGSHFFEWTHRRFGGDEFPATVLLTRVEIDGQMLLQATVRDITAQKRAEEQLRAQKKKLARERANLQAIFDASQVGMLLVDEDMQVVRVNNVVVQLVDKETSELLYDQPGNGLCCIHASQTPEGCGHAAACPDCPVRNAVERVLQEGQTIRNAEWALRLAIKGEEKQLFFTASITPLFLEEKKYALIALSGTTHRKKRERRDSLLNALQRQLLSPGLLAEKMKLITDAVTEMVDADFTRIWLIQHGDRCDQCVHSQATDEANTCRTRESCLHLVASSGRYTHVDGGIHSRVPLGCYKIGQIASGEESHYLIDDVTADPGILDHQWAARLGLVSCAGYKLQDANGQVIGVMALFANYFLSREIDEFLDNIAHLTSQVIMAGRAEAERLELYDKFVESSRIAGMAEVATGVLHNVGNVLNSINVSAQVATDRVKKSRITGLVKANELIEQHADDLATFITSHESGKHLPEFLRELAKQLHVERDFVLDELGILREHIEHIKEIISMQQSFAHVAGVMERLNVADIVEAAIKINDAGLSRHSVTLKRDYKAIPSITSDKHKILQILVNLISNAKRAYALKSTFYHMLWFDNFAIR